MRWVDENWEASRRKIRAVPNSGSDISPNLFLIFWLFPIFLTYLSGDTLVIPKILVHSLNNSNSKGRFLFWVREKRALKVY